MVTNSLELRLDSFLHHVFLMARWLASVSEASEQSIPPGSGPLEYKPARTSGSSEYDDQSAWAELWLVNDFIFIL